MGKILAKYRGYTPTELKNRAEIPSAGNIIVNANDIDCSNISLNAVKNVLGAGTYSLYDLCRHANINRWSGFSPIIHTVAAQAIVNSVPSICRLGDFAGYNHGAVAPGWLSGPTTSDLWVNNGGNAEFSVDVVVGELQYHNITPGIVGVTFAVYDGASIVAWASRNFESAGVTDNVTGLIATWAVFAEKTYTGKVWLVDDTSDFDGSQIVARLPNTTDFTRTVKIKTASTASYDVTGTLTPPAPWIQNGSTSMNWTTGKCTITYDLEANETYTNLRVYAELRNWLGTLVASGNFYNAAYNPLDSVFGEVDFGIAPIDTFGYTVKIFFEYTI